MYYMYELLFPSGKKYVGITNNPRHRMSQHVSSAFKGSKFPVHAALRLYGAENVKMCILGGAEELEEIAALEIREIARQGTLVPGGYNLTLGGDLSPTLSPAVRARIAGRQKGKKLSPTHLANLTAANRRAEFTPARAAQLAAAREKGRLVDQVSKGRKISASKIGHPVSEETRAKLRARFLGRPRGKSILPV